jgi:starvation-inducible outer membrane lipoprotein
MRRRLLLTLVCLALSGCASVFPGQMLQGVDRSLTVGVLRSDPDRYRDARVVLAGEIIDTRPRAGGTEIEVLSRPLGDGDAPDAPTKPRAASSWSRPTFSIPRCTRAAGA